MKKELFNGVGRRKESTARVYLSDGSGTSTVNKKLNIDYINLVDYYKKIDEFTDKEIKFFVNENSEKLKQDYIDFSYVIITPENLTGLKEFKKTINPL